MPAPPKWLTVPGEEAFHFIKSETLNRELHPLRPVFSSENEINNIYLKGCLQGLRVTTCEMLNPETTAIST